MTLEKAIAHFDAERVNSLDVAKKIRWVSQLDYKIFSEITEPRGDGGFKPYNIASPLATPLRAPDEFAEIYTLYLNMRLDYMNGELARYNNSALLFNNMYRDMCNYINRNRQVLKKTQIKAGDIYV